MTYVLITCQNQSHDIYDISTRFSRNLQSQDLIESRNSSPRWDEKTYNQINAISVKFIFYLSHVLHPLCTKFRTENYLDAFDFGLNDILFECFFVREYVPMLFSQVSFQRTFFQKVQKLKISKNFISSKNIR